MILVVIFLAALETLNEIILKNDNLTGRLPPQIGKLKNVTVFDLHWCHTTTVCQLPNLQNFTYSSNYSPESQPPSCAATAVGGKVASNGTNNCIPGKADQGSSKECSSEAACPVDCCKLQCGGSESTKRPPVLKPPASKSQAISLT
ncbi:hypothetical protein Dsin_001511 [Dipteronia sinensis]|uniref:Uncharacterized protein n=1 Tax=Dipteronia sinensis TaxID=43782 RepID=A0AAE0EKC9_9ROSI|nr:hypothetical protein Dsin_001511 [Dipteronia sinensis]